MRVLHVTNAFPTEKNSSYGIFIKEQIASLEKIGITCNVVFINALANGKLDYFRKIKDVRAAAKDVDLVHCHHAYSAFITSFFARVKKPIVVSFLSSKVGETETLFRRIIYSYVMKRCSAFIDNSNPGTSASTPGRGYYLPNGVDMGFFQEMTRKAAMEKLSLPPGKYALFCASGDIYRPEKRYYLYQKVLANLREKHGIEMNELLLSNIERIMTPYYYNAASFHLLTSSYEGSPNSVKEALACDIPVVSTDVGNVKILVDGVAGCYVSSTDNAEEMASLCVKALEHDRIEGRKKLLENGMGMESIAASLSGIYEKILRK